MKLSKKQIEIQDICETKKFTNLAFNVIFNHKVLMVETIKKYGRGNSYVKNLLPIKSVAYFEVENVGVYYCQNLEGHKHLIIDAISGYPMYRGDSFTEAISHIEKNISKHKGSLNRLRAKFLSDFARTPKRYFI